VIVRPSVFFVALRLDAAAVVVNREGTVSWWLLQRYYCVDF
jgi:hypothetical protein